jgi:hypothetical protein
MLIALNRLHWLLIIDCCVVMLSHYISFLRCSMPSHLHIWSFLLHGYLPADYWLDGVTLHISTLEVSFSFNFTRSAARSLEMLNAAKRANLGTSSGSSVCGKVLSPQPLVVFIRCKCRVFLFFNKLYSSGAPSMNKLQLPQFSVKTFFASFQPTCFGSFDRKL